MTDTHISVDATVECTDGRAGFVTTVLVNPVRNAITHIVVQTSKDSDRIVPLDRVVAYENDRVTLDCSLAELKEMPLFTETHYLKVEDPDYSMYQSGAYQYPYVANLWDNEEPVEQEQVPPGELAIHRGTKVAATDGNVGELEEFVIDESSGRITHFILRKGHLWGKRDIAIPITAVDYTESDKVYLTLSKAEIDALPGVKVRRQYRR